MEGADLMKQSQQPSATVPGSLLLSAGHRPCHYFSNNWMKEEPGLSLLHG